MPLFSVVRSEGRSLWLTFLSNAALNFFTVRLIVLFAVLYTLVFISLFPKSSETLSLDVPL